MRTLKIAFLTLVFLTSGAVSAQSVVLDNPAYQRCEAEAFISLLIARNAMFENDTRESLLAIKNNGDFQIATINEVFDDLNKTGNKNHAAFAMRKFYLCVARENLSIQDDNPNAFICLARQDIAFYAEAGKNKGFTQDVNVAELKKFFSKSSKVVYSDSLIEQITPMVYRAKTSDGSYLIRQIIFQSCRFPDEWRLKNSPRTGSTN